MPAAFVANLMLNQTILNQVLYGLNTINRSLNLASKKIVGMSKTIQD